MKTKQEIVENWLPRYTKHALEDFGEYILLTNFNNYVDIFCEKFGVEKPDYTSNMRTATADGISIINFGMGSPNAAIIMDLLSAVSPKACLFLGWSALIALIMMLCGAVGTGVLPAAYFGIPERFSVFAAALFNAALGVALFRDFR